ncbi:MAG: alanine racemase [Thiotrichales bacterium]
MSRPARAIINLAALQHNFALLRSVAGESRILSVVKADAYGHGVFEVVDALRDSDGFAVACVEEGLELRSVGVDKPILVMQGAHHAEELTEATEAGLMMVIHQIEQIEDLPESFFLRPELWLKLDTGMGRLGIPVELADEVLEKLGARCTTLMTHFANADRPEDPRNEEQFIRFDWVVRRHSLAASAANSAATFALPTVRYQWVRPGLMLYGGSPFLEERAPDLGLQAVMTFAAPVIAVNWHRQGDLIGYGSSYACPEDMAVGVIAVGYADGYPRHAPTGTPVLIDGKIYPLIGRVSMDMITVDLREHPSPVRGMTAVLWGEGLPIDRVANMAGTLSYELMCAAGARCIREYSYGEPDLSLFG